jgi:hypothetical protein
MDTGWTCMQSPEPFAPCAVLTGAESRRASAVDAQLGWSGPVHAPIGLLLPLCLLACGWGWHGPLEALTMPMHMSPSSTVQLVLHLS